ncbi:hypothetical protein ACFXKC_11500 [Streptomyces sp. NPDC059340]|uniref:hypothetical protein n=1 Tax=Streptomyces sp. NPDC059340 TaxID=3346806 RepID=UPI0036A4B8ED
MNRQRVRSFGDPAVPREIQPGPRLGDELSNLPNCRSTAAAPPPGTFSRSDRASAARSTSSGSNASRNAAAAAPGSAGTPTSTRAGTSSSAG